MSINNYIASYFQPIQNLIAPHVSKSGLVAKIPIYGPYDEYTKHTRELKKRLTTLKYIRYEMAHRNPNDPRLTKMDRRICQLRNQIKTEYNEATVSIIGSVAGPIANALVPGSGPLVAIGSNLTKTWIHNREAPKIEKKSIPQQVLKSTLSQTAQAALKSFGRLAYSFLSSYSGPIHT